MDPAEDVLEDISFYFFAAPAGVDYHLTISDVSSGTILLSRDFHAIGGQNLFTLGLDLDGVSQISADIASSVYGMRAGFVSNVYSGGQASFSGYANSLYDLAFIANFSDGSGDGDGGPSLVPLPASLPLLATVLLGAGLAGRRGRKA